LAAVVAETADVEVGCDEVSPSVWVWPQAESFNIFSASFADHSVHGFETFWAATEAAHRTSIEQVNRILLVMGLSLRNYC
jgi:hypothetical protein